MANCPNSTTGEHLFSEPYTVPALRMNGEVTVPERTLVDCEACYTTYSA